MSKNIKKTIIFAVILVVLVLLMIILKVTDNTDDKKDVTTTAAAVSERLVDYSGYDVSVTDILSIDVKNAESEYTVLYNDGSCVIADMNYDFNSSVIDTIPSNALTATIINKPTGTSGYGFEDPQAEYTINFTDNRSMTVIIGNVSPVASETYVKLGENIFTISTYLTKPYLQNETYYLSPVVYPAFEKEEDKAIDSVEISIHGAEYSVKISKRTDLHSQKAFSPYQYILTYPAVVSLNKTKADTYITSIFGLTADRVVGIENKSAGYNPYRQNEYLCTVLYRNPDISFDIYKAPEDSDLDYYLIQNHSNLVYGFSAETIVDNEGNTEPKLPWLAIEPTDIISSYTITELSVWAYKSLVVETADKTYNFECNASEDKETFTVELDGATYDRDRFQKFNAFLLDGYINYGDFNPAKGERLAKITITMGYGEVYTVEYFEDTENPLNVVSYVNGSAFGALSVDYINSLFKNLELLNTEETFVSRKSGV
ncbi:MAG: DUF4340 domain-containing protein [Oscillospiraceae bacterium]|jgi:hypothetical protein|nr:DUF4340 domain-containing protein [Oscillospiraceae bacterium]